ncbi:MAG: PorT family protein [Cyclobacteriaceae bacterium]|nr:PorT family protein [Cyclobacteriaceae bacterium]
MSLPLLVKYNITPRFYVMGGPQVSYLVSSKYEQESIGNGTVTTTNNLDAMNKFGFGIVPVLGYDFDKFSLGIRYYAGLSQLNKDDNLNRSLKSEVLSLVLRYTLFDVND